MVGVDQVPGAACQALASARLSCIQPPLLGTGGIWFSLEERPLVSWSVAFRIAPVCLPAVLKEGRPPVPQVSVAVLPGSPWGHPALPAHLGCEAGTPPQTRKRYMVLKQYFI